MRITKIKIKNFKAFQDPDIIDLGDIGKNLLLYGENGSGKTSLYKALELCLESSENQSKENHSISFDDHKNFEALDNGDSGYVKLRFTDNSNLSKDTYEWSDSEVALDNTEIQQVIDASKAKRFLDYKTLLHTHYLHYEKDTVDLFDLLIKTLLKNIINGFSDPERSFRRNGKKLQKQLFRNKKMKICNNLRLF